MLPRSNLKRRADQGFHDQILEVQPKKMQMIKPPEANDSDNGACPITSLDITDDQWLRSRTNGLLDIVDPDEVNKSVATGNTSSAECRVAATGLEPVEEMEFKEGPGSADPNINAIQGTGRLFVRNLPYSATEDDLRKFFEPFGIIEEVRIFQLGSKWLYDDYPDRDNLCLQASDASWTSILVDTSCSLRA